MVYVELPAVGATLTAGKTFGVVESVKVRRGATLAHPQHPAAARAQRLYPAARRHETESAGRAGAEIGPPGGTGCGPGRRNRTVPRA